MPRLPLIRSWRSDRANHARTKFCSRSADRRKMAAWTDAYKKWEAFDDSDDDETTINDDLVVTPHAPR